MSEVNKERVRKKLYAWCRKVWPSELSAYNKATAHNIFIISIITPTFGITDWTIEELKEIDKRTRKTLCMKGSFHPSSDIDGLYIPRYQGRRGLKSVKSLFECRIVSLYNHLQTHKNRNEYANYVYQQEESQSIRVGQELTNKNNVVTSSNINEVIRAVLNFFLRKDFVRTKKHKNATKQKHKTQISEQK